MSWKFFILLPLAGAAGTLARFGGLKMAELLTGNSAGFPCATLAVNVCGAFFAGLLFALSSGKFPELKAYLPILMIGFLGAFTTFSTFALESMKMIGDGEYFKALCNIVGQNALGLAFAFGGVWTGRLFC